MQNFYNHRFIGTQIEELIKLLLTESGYQVYDFAYERILPAICEKYRKEGIKSTSAFLRIRHSPDLLVYDDMTHELMLVEVKMRSVSSDMRVFIDRFNMMNYMEFWKDALLVIVVNSDHVFYTQKIEQLKLSNEEYNLSVEFQKIEEIFSRIGKEELLNYKNKSIQILNSNTQKCSGDSKTNSYSFSEKKHPREYEKWKN